MASSTRGVVVKILVDVGGFEWRRTTGPLHDELRTGTLEETAERAGVQEFDALRDWADMHARWYPVLTGKRTEFIGGNDSSERAVYHR